MRRLLLASVSLLATVPVALSADLPSSGVPLAPAPIFVTPGWAGSYVGAQLGATQLQDKTGLFVLFGAPVIPGSTQTFRSTGLTGGVYGGHNWQFNTMVLGLEMDANLSAARKTTVVMGTLPFGAGDSIRMKQDWDASVVAKLGYALGSSLVYVLGGATVAHFGVNYNLTAVIGGVPQTNADFAVGWTAGAGLAYKFSPNWSARAEYRYSDFGKQTHALAATAITAPHNRTTQRGMVGLTYHFGATPAAVVAKY